MDDTRNLTDEATSNVRPLFPDGAPGADAAGGSAAPAVPEPSPLDKALAGYLSQLGQVRQSLQNTMAQANALSAQEQQLIGAVSALEAIRNPQEAK